MKEVTVKYKKQTNYCYCCDQEIKKPKQSINEFKFTEETCLNWIDKESWNITASCKHELDRVVEDFCYETIDFFATSSNATITIEDIELKKVKELILNNVISS